MRAWLALFAFIPSIAIAFPMSFDCGLLFESVTTTIELQAHDNGKLIVKEDSSGNVGELALERYEAGTSDVLTTVAADLGEAALAFTFENAAVTGAQVGAKVPMQITYANAQEQAQESRECTRTK